MRNLKKIIAVVVTFVMLLSIATIAASAENEPTLALYGKGETGLTNTDKNTGEGKQYYELTVHLTDAGNVIGGIEGAITYDTNMFNYVGAELNQKFIDAGNPVDTAATVVCNNDDGTIRFVGLNNAESTGEWFVLKFEVVATGSANFAFAGVKGANTEGYVTVNVKKDTTVVKNEDILNVAGASIKKIDDPNKQDIRFHVDVNHELLGEKTVKEYGLLLMFTKRLESLGYAELEYEMIANEQEGLAYAVAKGDITVDSYAVNLNNMQENALGVKVSARAFAVLSDDTVIYSKNYNSTYGTNAGYESKSVIDVARKAALDCSGADEATVENITRILGEKSIKGEDRTALLSYINTYYKKK